MADLQVFDFDEAEWTQTYDAPFCKVSGDFHAKSAKLLNYSLWTIMARLAPGTSIAWDGAHGDEVVMVLAGSIEVDGVAVPEFGSMVVETGVDVELRATEQTELMHWGPTDPSPPVEGLVGPAAPRPAHVRGVHVHGELGR